MRPLIYLEVRQFVNSVKNTVRSPKRLIPTLMMGAWVVAWLIQSLVFLAGGPAPTSGPGAFPLPVQMTAEAVEIIRLVVFLALSIGSVIVMYGAFSSGLLVFSVAHIDFLFPTPISRRKVLLIKLLKDYLKYGFWVAFFFMFAGSPMLSRMHIGFLPWGLVSIGAVVALLLTLVNVAHTINIVFTFGFERLRRAGMLIKALLILVPATFVVYAIYQYVTTGGSYASLLLAANSPVVGVLFAPTRWCADLFLAPLLGVTSEEWTRFVLLWLMAVGSAVLLFSRKENVYEPSLGISARAAKRKAMMGARNYADLRQEALREKGAKHAGVSVIPPFGEGATAFVWKNLVLRYRVYRGQIIFMAILPLVVVYAIRRFVPDQDFARYVPFAMVYIVWILSMAAQAEMRAELRYANTVKSMPIAAWKVVFAQVMSSVAYMTSGLALFAFYLAVLVPASRGPILWSCLIAAPSVGFATIPGALIASLMYPDAKDMAQNYLCGMLGFLLSSLAVIPTVVIGAASILLLHLPIYIAVALIFAANLLVGAAGISMAGVVFRKFDPTTE